MTACGLAMANDLEYRFILQDNQTQTYTFQFDGERYELSEERHAPAPWCELSFQQCPNCPYQSNGPKYCPAALRLNQVVRDVDHMMSYEQIEVEVITRHRTIKQTSTVQEAVSSLLGLLLASSGCPHTEFLLPMARFHLPFANAEETLWRACGSFLLAQYFRREEDTPTELLEDILRHYANLEVLNSQLVKRLKSQVHSDACPNAIVLLDNYAKHFPLFIERSIEQLKPLYTAYLMPK